MNALRPQPVHTRWSEEFWAGIDRRELLVQVCTDCGKLAGYPKVFCPHCYSDALEWKAVSGRGKIYSFSTITANPPSTFIDEVPYTIVIVELDDGPRFLSSLVEADIDKVACEAPVEVVYERVDGDLVLPLFRLT